MFFSDVTVARGQRPTRTGKDENKRYEERDKKYCAFIELRARVNFGFDLFRWLRFPQSLVSLGYRARATIA